MTIAWVSRLLSALGVALVLASGQPPDLLVVNQPRPMLVLARELVDRFGYLVTYEDAPSDPNRDVQTRRRADGVEEKLLMWKPIAFRIGTTGSPILKQSNDANSSVSLSEPRGSASSNSLSHAAMETLLNEYHESGNSGQFMLLWEQDYAHILPASRPVSGKSQAFLPVLSTTVPVSKQIGQCMEIFDELLAELHSLRGVTIVGVALPLKELVQRQCSIQGHDLPARAVLTQLLEQVGRDPRTSLPDNQFVWSLVHDPTSGNYFLSTRIVLPQPYPSSRLDSNPKSPGIRTQPSPFSIPAESIKKK